MSTPETIRADAREDERYNRDGPSPDQPCDAEFCSRSDESEPDKAGLFVHEVTRGMADVMVYCSCEHHGADIEQRIWEVAR